MYTAAKFVMDEMHLEQKKHPKQSYTMKKLSLYRNRSWPACPIYCDAKYPANISTKPLQ